MLCAFSIWTGYKRNPTPETLKLQINMSIVSSTSVSTKFEDLCGMSMFSRVTVAGQLCLCLLALIYLLSKHLNNLWYETYISLSLSGNNFGGVDQQVGNEDTNVPLVVGTTVPTVVVVAAAIGGGCWWLMSLLKRRVSLIHL